MAPFRPPGRSNRSGRTNADNDVFEGLPVKQWTHAPTRVSLVPPASEVVGIQGPDRWGEPPMPRDWQLLQPWTQALLKLARSGRLGQKRKATRDADDGEAEDYGARDEDANGGEDVNGLSKGSIHSEDRAFVAKKWRHVPEHALVPEHLHMEYLARSRKGMPSFYHGLNADGYGAPLPLRKTKVFRVTNAETNEIAVYEILIPEGQPIDNEVLEGSEHAAIEPQVLTVGTFIEGLGTANIDGVLIGEVRGAAAVAQRRNRPPPKKKGGPGRGKKRVTFTNPDGSTYTTIVPNATKIVPQPGQTVKHVAKGEEAAADITAEEAASLKAAQQDHDGEDDGDEDDEGDDDGEDGDDREDGELVDDTLITDAQEEDTKPSTPQADAPDAAGITETKTEVTETAPEDPIDTVIPDAPPEVQSGDTDITEAAPPEESAVAEISVPEAVVEALPNVIAAGEQAVTQPVAQPEVDLDTHMQDADIHDVVQGESTAEPQSIIPDQVPEPVEPEPITAPSEPAPPAETENAVQAEQLIAEIPPASADSIESPAVVAPAEEQ